MTLEQVEKRLEELYKSYDATLVALEYSTADGRRVRREQLTTISKEIQKFEKLLNKIKKGNNRIIKILPMAGEL